MEQFHITIERSKRKTLSLQVKKDGSIVAKAPLRMSEREIQRFIQEKTKWLQETVAKVNAANEAGKQNRLTDEELYSLAIRAKEIFPEKTRFFAQRMGVTYGRITIRNQATRWGSCSSAGNLNYNCLLMMAPEEIQDYVVVHELAHRKQMNHSQAFWDEVSSVLPDYKTRLKWLKDNGRELMSRAGK